MQTYASLEERAYRKPMNLVCTFIPEGEYKASMNSRDVQRLRLRGA